MRTRTCLAALAVAALPAAALADSASDTAALRAEIEALKQHYDARIAALESRLAAAETAADSGVLTSTPVAAPPTAATGRATPFNPSMSLVLNGRYAAFERNPESYRIGGFVPAGEAGPGERSFDIDESELTLSANIDPNFSGYFVAAFDGEDAAEVEEAYLTHTGLAPGGTLKFGRYKVGFGYQNEQHTHAWDFVDAPLAMQTFLGGSLADDGVQVRWLAPTDAFIELGAEVGLGNAFPGSTTDRNTPASTGFFAHVGGDLGASWSYRMGSSYRSMNAQARAYEDTDAAGAEVTNLFSGDVDMWGLDAVWKWAPNGARQARNLTLQAEYYDAASDGALTFDADGAALTDDYDAEQSGWYAQAVFQFMPRWRLGARYDALDSGTVDIGLVRSGALARSEFPILADNDPRRWTTMLDFSPTEFSRLRLQYARDEARFEDPDDQLFVQYIMSMGAHGAHKF
jgi:hypothetical protein